MAVSLASALDEGTVGIVAECCGADWGAVARALTLAPGPAPGGPRACLASHLREVVMSDAARVGSLGGSMSLPAHSGLLGKTGASRLRSVRIGGAGWEGCDEAWLGAVSSLGWSAGGRPVAAERLQVSNVPRGAAAAEALELLIEAIRTGAPRLRELTLDSERPVGVPVRPSPSYGALTRLSVSGSGLTLECSPAFATTGSLSLGMLRLACSVPTLDLTALPALESAELAAGRLCVTGDPGVAPLGSVRAVSLRLPPTCTSLDASGLLRGAATVVFVAWGRPARPPGGASDPLGELMALGAPSGTALHGCPAGLRRLGLPAGGRCGLDRLLLADLLAHTAASLEHLSCAVRGPGAWRHRLCAATPAGGADPARSGAATRLPRLRSLELVSRQDAAESAVLLATGSSRAEAAVAAAPPPGSPVTSAGLEGFAGPDGGPPARPPALRLDAPSLERLRAVGAVALGLCLAGPCPLPAELSLSATGSPAWGGGAHAAAWMQGAACGERLASLVSLGDAGALGRPLGAGAGGGASLTLRSLPLPPGSLRAWAEAARPAPSCRISLDCVHGTGAEELAAAVASLSPGLTSLCVRGESLHDAPDTVPWSNPRHAASQLAGPALLGVLREAPSLRELELAGQSRVSTADVAEIVDAAPLLRALRLRSLLGCDDAALGTLMARVVARK